MAITAQTLKANTSTDAPGASWSSASFSYTANNIYAVFVTQYRTDSVDPPTPTATFAGTSMGAADQDDLWDTSGTSRRRSTAFTYVPTNSGTGVVIATAASAPAYGSVTVIELATDGAPSGTLVPQSASGDVSGVAGALQEIGALSALSSAGNVLVGCVAANVDVSATARFELSGDTGGDDSWTTGTIATNTSPAAAIIPGWLAGGTDLTPGYYQNTGTPSAWLQVLEISETTTPVTNPGITAPYLGIFAGSAPSIVQSSGMFIGATVDPEWPETGVQAIANFEAELGVPKIDIIRSFQGGMPTTYAGGGNHNDWDSHIGVRHRVISVKGEPTQAQLETFIASIPSDQYKTWLIVHHEPENDGGNHTPAWFQTMLDNLHAAWLSVDGGNGRADVVPSLCLMTWLERDNNANTSSADWFPRSAIIGDFTLWLDPYDPNSVRTLQQQTQATLDLWRAEGGSAWGIAETGTKRTGADLANWIAQGCAWARSEGATGWCWFHSAVGQDGPWWLEDPQGLAALGAEVVGV